MSTAANQALVAIGLCPASEPMEVGPIQGWAWSLPSWEYVWQLGLRINGLVIRLSWSLGPQESTSAGMYGESDSWEFIRRLLS